MITVNNFEWFHIGAKAERLFRMKRNGLNVPELFCVTENTEEAEVNAYVRRKFPAGTKFAVRSSATAEDSDAHSFAGQLDTFLFVPADQLWEKICLSRASADTQSVNDYLQFCGIRREDVDLHVIVQVMVDADCAGVIFTANPQGILNETVITVGAGTGDGIVEDRVPVNTYYCSRSDDSFYAEIREDAPKLTSGILKKLMQTASDIRNQFACECDIEYAVKNGEIFILQARPITTLHPDGHVILDSSNIPESYQGISSPLTISFAKELCHAVFSNCVRRITRSDGTAEKLDSVLADMTDAANGRIYHRLSSWYDAIALLPFSKKILPVWQEMLGISDQSITRSGTALKRSTKFRILRSFVHLILTNKRKMQALKRDLDAMYPVFRERIRHTDDPAALMQICTEIKEALAESWDLTLVNELYTFIFRGACKRSLAAHGYDNPEKTADQIIFGSETMEQVRADRQIAAICDTLQEESLYETFCAISSAAEVKRFLCRPCKSADLMKEYLEEYGDRCAWELKLEAETCRTDPMLLVEAISEYSGAEKALAEGRPKLRGLSGLFAKKAAQGAVLRERAETARAKIFGLIRETVLKCGDYFSRRGLIAHPRDIFCLTFDELKQAAEGSVSGMRTGIASRRRQWDAFRTIPPYTRIVFDRKVFDKHPANCISETMCKEEALIYGTPCSSGIVEGEITHISRLNADTDVSGKIILADVTDPGWVFVISRALGIISKRGSFLSHTAIISRELKKPAVVGVGNACNHFRDGDYVRLNGIDGTVELIRRAG